MRPRKLVRQWLVPCTLALVSSLGLISLAQHSRADDAQKSDPVTIDFELMRSMHMAVQVKLNDAGPYRLIFDLGAPVTLVSGRAALAGGLISKEKAAKKTFFGMRGEAKVKKFEVGSVTASDVSVMVMDHPTVEAAASFLGPLDGIVGYPFFARYKFTIDYSAKQMTFTPTDYEPQNVMSQMLGRMLGGDQKKLAAPAALVGFVVEKKDEDDAPGVIVATVYADSPAAAAGLMPGDRLLTLDDRWCDSVADTIDAATFLRPGETTRVSLRRNNELLVVNLTPRVGL